MSYLVSFCSCVFSVLFALRLPRLGKRELILVLFVRLFDLCLFGLFGFLFPLVSGKGCGLCTDLEKLWVNLTFRSNSEHLLTVIKELAIAWILCGRLDA